MIKLESTFKRTHIYTQQIPYKKSIHHLDPVLHFRIQQAKKKNVFLTFHICSPFFSALNININNNNNNYIVCVMCLYIVYDAIELQYICLHTMTIPPLIYIFYTHFSCIHCDV